MTNSQRNQGRLGCLSDYLGSDSLADMMVSLNGLRRSDIKHFRAEIQYDRRDLLPGMNYVRTCESCNVRRSAASLTAPPPLEAKKTYARLNS